VSSGEFEFIQTLANFANKHPQSLGLQDDGAIISCGDRKLVVVKDLVQAGVHALDHDTDIDIVRKAIRVNLSDLAAMGARPEFLLLAICFNEIPNSKLLAAAIESECKEFNVALIGGDTVMGKGPTTVCITAIGYLAGPAILRSGAMVGDDIWVSGALGDAALGLRLLQSNENSSEFLTLNAVEKSYLSSRYRWPEPRIALGEALGGIATAMIDISDGLKADASHISKSSNIAMKIDVNLLPKSAAFRKWADKTTELGMEYSVLFGGDDYELLFTANCTDREEIMSISARTGCSITRIGQVKPGKYMKFFREGTEVKLSDVGFTHF